MSDVLNEQKQQLLNRIIAVGLNSLSEKYSPDEELINNFIHLSLKEILPCWELLDSKIKFRIFQVHLVEFEKFLKEQGK